MKKLLLLLGLLLGTAAASNVYDNLIGKNEKILVDNDMFQCRFHICTALEKFYFNNPLLDKTVNRIETYADERGEIYKIDLHVAHVGEFENHDITQGFFNALKLHGSTASTKKLEYSLKYISDKYGNRSIVSIIDTDKQSAYQTRMQKKYVEALESYAKQK